MGLLLISGPGGGKAQSEGVVSQSCCPQVFLSSSGPLASSQSQAMGIYTLTSQKIAGNSHPVYHKSAHGEDYYLYYRDQEEGPRGWLVGGALLENVFFLTTKQEGARCPAGLYGGWDTNSERDSTFGIECHSDQVNVDCCGTVTISSSGAVASQNGGVLGEYTKVDDFNGHAAYRGGHLNVSLFYRKAGHGSDGWMVGPGLDQNTLMVTTRNKGFCPDVVVEGFQNDKVQDPTLRVSCSVPLSEIQDPGVPVSPLVLEPLTNRKSINSSARDTVINSACFRIICTLYLAVQLLAGQY